IGLVLRAAFSKDAAPNAWVDILILEICLFISVLLHEFGHCFGARAVNGDAREILMWPLGGLARCEVPHTPRANFITTLAGPAVNLVLALAALLALYFAGSYQPNWDPTRYVGQGSAFIHNMVPLKTWAGEHELLSPYSWPVLVHHIFWVNYVLFLLNMVLLGFPMDGGRLLQAVLWKYLGYRRGTLGAIYAGFVT